MAKKKNLCRSCLYWDQRPEEGMTGDMGYCRQKENIVTTTIKCKFYRKLTAKSRESLYRDLYGEIEDEEVDEEGD